MSTPANDMLPGDEVPPGTPYAGENLCRKCAGHGKRQEDERACKNCGGTGIVYTIVSG